MGVGPREVRRPPAPAVVWLVAATAALAVIVAEDPPWAESALPGQVSVRIAGLPLVAEIDDVDRSPAPGHGVLELASADPGPVLDAVAPALREGLRPGAAERLGRIADSTTAASVALERACPPPALLACRPGLLVAARLADPDPRSTSHLVAGLARAGLRASGFRGLRVRAAADGSGRVRAGGERLAEWRLDGATLRVAGGLPLEHSGLPPPRPAGRTGTHGAPSVSVWVDPPALATLLAGEEASAQAQLRSLDPVRATIRMAP